MKRAGEEMDTTRNKAHAIDAEWDARIELAAVYRLMEYHGWGESIYNHISLRVPGEPRRFLIKKHELTYTEVDAGNLVKVEMDEDLDESAGVNRPGFVLHGGILQARPDVNCALHAHTIHGIAVSALRLGLRMLSQYAVRFYQSVGYHDYEGITDGMDERPRLVANLNRNSALIMRNHGILTVGRSAASAFIAMKDLITACQIQLAVEATGAEIAEISPAVCASTAKQFAAHDDGRGSADWPGYLRLLDRLDPSYRSGR